MLKKLSLWFVAIKAFFSTSLWKYISWGIIAVLLVSLIISTSVYKAKYKKTKQEVVTTEQSLQDVRDSLKNAPSVTYNIEMAVKDYSILQCKNTGKGSVNVPSTKTYILKIDSSSVKVQAVGESK